MVRALQLWLLLALFAGAAMLLALASGSLAIAPADVLRLLWQPDGGSAAQVLHTLRLPRALAAFGVGGLLAVAGALMQVLLRNPLADPYVLGISGGAAVGALLALLLAGSALLVNAGAFAGAMVTIVLVFALAQRDLSRVDTTARLESAPRLLLTGVMLAALWSAVITLLLMLAPEARLRGMLFWLAGDLGGSDASGWPLAVLAVLLLAAWPLARELNVLLRGAASAQALGVSVVRLRRVVYLLASLATAVAVTTGGAIGFVGQGGEGKGGRDEKAQAAQGGRATTGREHRMDSKQPASPQAALLAYAGGPRVAGGCAWQAGIRARGSMRQVSHRGHRLPTGVRPQWH